MAATVKENSTGNLSNGSVRVDCGDMRLKYKDKSEVFTEDQLVSKEPFGQFRDWFETARKTPTIEDPSTVLLATATKDGMPSLRPVSMKEFGTDGFKFHTSYESRKGRELDENPNAALAFFWEPLRRTVRIEGTVEKLKPEVSDRFFDSRPHDGKIVALLSKQSTSLRNRDELEKELEKEIELLKDSPHNIKRPDWWGGYVVIPKSVEFWQGQSDRLHDRIRFRRLNPGEKVDNVLLHEGVDGWVYERLSP